MIRNVSDWIFYADKALIKAANSAGSTVCNISPIGNWEKFAACDRSQLAATTCLGTCCKQEVAASWLRAHAANVHGASSGNCFPFSPTTKCPFLPEVRCTHHV